MKWKSNAVQIVAPVPDSHYRLKSCQCGNDQAVYIQGKDEQWRVECPDCGNKTGGHGTRHGAQMDWNGGRRHES